MSKHRIKSVVPDDDYDDDDDGYEEGYGDDGNAEEDSLTAEDKEKLRIGTAQVQHALGPGLPSVTEREIQDTLWHYYYDVAKSVTYLKSTAPLAV
jgi:elongation factor 1 alpha-like protein